MEDLCLDDPTLHHAARPVQGHLIRQVIDKSEHEAVRDGDHELGTTGREAEEDAGRKEHEQEGRENGHDNVEHRFILRGKKRTRRRRMFYSLSSR